MTSNSNQCMLLNKSIGGWYEYINFVKYLFEKS